MPQRKWQNLIHQTVTPGNMTGTYYILVSNLPPKFGHNDLRAIARSVVHVEACVVYPFRNEGWICVRTASQFYKLCDYLDGFSVRGRKLVASDENKDQSVDIWVYKKLWGWDKSKTPATGEAGGMAGMADDMGSADGPMGASGGAKGAAAPSGTKERHRSSLAPGDLVDERGGGGGGGGNGPDAASAGVAAVGPYGGGGAGYGSDPPTAWYPAYLEPPRVSRHGLAGGGWGPAAYHPGNYGYGGHSEGPLGEMLPLPLLPPLPSLPSLPPLPPFLPHPPPEMMLHPPPHPPSRAALLPPASPPPPPASLKVIVKNLSRHASTRELEAFLLQAIGGAHKLREAIRFPRLPAPSSSASSASPAAAGRQHAFLLFHTHDDAVAAVARLDRAELYGLTLEARLAKETVLLRPPWRRGGLSASAAAGQWASASSSSSQSLSLSLSLPQRQRQAVPPPPPSPPPVVTPAATPALPPAHNLVVDGSGAYGRAQRAAKAAAAKARERMSRE